MHTRGCLLTAAVHMAAAAGKDSAPQSRHLRGHSGRPSVPQVYCRGDVENITRFSMVQANSAYLANIAGKWAGGGPRAAMEANKGKVLMLFKKVWCSLPRVVLASR